MIEDEWPIGQWLPIAARCPTFGNTLRTRQWPERLRAQKQLERPLRVPARR
jgi:hypothetical protein